MNKFIQQNPNFSLIGLLIGKIYQSSLGIFSQDFKPVLLFKQLNRETNKDALESTQIDEWIDFLNEGISLNSLEKHLQLRSFLVGYKLSLADVLIWGFLAQDYKKKNFVNLNRWFDSINSIPVFKESLQEFKKIGNKDQQGNFDIQLKNAEMGKVVTRFPPEPSGYLHIGHAKAALLNDYFAKLYKGKLLLRFDDTNPSKEKMEYENSIKEDLELLGIKADSVSHTSDHFSKIYDYAITMIKSGLAYVDDTDQETMRAQRFDGIESKCRNKSVEENLRDFEEMKNGTAFGLKSCLRAKIDMTDKNKAMRDPVIYRCNLIPHPHTGTTYKMYPTYDFVCPIVDSIEGVTHALRTNEYRDRNPQYEWFLKALNLRWVHIWDYSRLNFVYTLLSKRKLTWFVEQGLVSGWDDPRFATVRGIRRRGMTIEALRSYILSQGASQRELSLEWDKLWNTNKKVIDPVASRYTALIKDKLVKVNVLDSVKPHEKTLPKHKKNPEVGTKITSYSSKLYLEFEDAKDLVEEEEVTFMDWGNVIVKKVNWNAEKSSLESIDISLHLEGDFKKTKKKLTWLSDGEGLSADRGLVNVLLLDYDYLITKKKLEEDDELEKFITPVTEFKSFAVGDGNLRLLKKGDVIQFERKGYYICDKPFDASNPNSDIHFILIPDGKVANMTSKATEAVTKDSGKAKQSKKAEKMPKAPLNSKNKMYAMDSIYDESVRIDQSKVSKMYPMDSVCVDQTEIETASIAVKTQNAVPNSKTDSPKKSKPAKQQTPAQEASIISKLDIVVGKILSVSKHPDADTLYVEEIDVGEEAPRTVVSGLVKFMKPEDMKDKTILVLKNLKPVSMRGVKSHAMVLCASDSTHEKVEFLIPPAGSLPGESVYFEGHEGTPELQLNPKKKVWESIQPDFSTRDDLVATWKGVEWRTKRGLVKTPSIPKATIK